MKRTIILALGGGLLLALGGCGLSADPQKSANLLNELSCGSPKAGVYYNGKKVEPNKPLSAEAAQRCRESGGKGKLSGTTISVD